MRNLETHKHFYNIKVKGGRLVTISKADFMWLIREEGLCEYSTHVSNRRFKVGDDDAVRVDHVHTLNLSA